MGCLGVREEAGEQSSPWTSLSGAQTTLDSDILTTSVCFYLQLVVAWRNAALQANQCHLPPAGGYLQTQESTVLPIMYACVLCIFSLGTFLGSCFQVLCI